MFRGNTHIVRWLCRDANESTQSTGSSSKWTPYNHDASERLTSLAIGSTATFTDNNVSYVVTRQSFTTATQVNQRTGVSQQLMAIVRRNPRSDDTRTQQNALKRTREEMSMPTPRKNSVLNLSMSISRPSMDISRSERRVIYSAGTGSVDHGDNHNNNDNSNHSCSPRFRFSNGSVSNSFRNTNGFRRVITGGAARIPARAAHSLSQQETEHKVAEEYEEPDHENKYRFQQKPHNNRSQQPPVPGTTIQRPTHSSWLSRSDGNGSNDWRRWQLRNEMRRSKRRRNQRLRAQPEPQPVGHNWNWNLSRYTFNGHQPPASNDNNGCNRNSRNRSKDAWARPGQSSQSSTHWTPYRYGRTQSLTFARTTETARQKLAVCGYMRAVVAAVGDAAQQTQAMLRVRVSFAAAKELIVIIHQFAKPRTLWNDNLCGKPWRIDAQEPRIIRYTASDCSPNPKQPSHIAILDEISNELSAVSDSNSNSKCNVRSGASAFDWEIRIDAIDDVQNRCNFFLGFLAAAEMDCLRSTKWMSYDYRERVDWQWNVRQRYMLPCCVGVSNALTYFRLFGRNSQRARRVGNGNFQFAVGDRIGLRFNFSRNDCSLYYNGTLVGLAYKGIPRKIVLFMNSYYDIQLSCTKLHSVH